MKSYQIYLSDNSQIHPYAPSSPPPPYSAPCHPFSDSNFLSSILSPFMPLKVQENQVVYNSPKAPCC